MRVEGALVLAVVLGGCTTTRVMQRDGCWVRETKRTLQGKTEELGPCGRSPPRWSEDRLTRLVQECVAQADYRWMGRAVEAWNRRQPLPAQERQEDVIRACMNEAATGVVTRNETLEQRLSEVSSDREALRTETERTGEHLRASHDRIAEWLGEAAKRPPPVATATATATSDGTATTESGLTSETGTASQAVPAAASPVLVPPPAVPASAAGPAARPAAPALEALKARAARPKRSRTARAPACDLPGAVQPAGVEPAAPGTAAAAPEDTGPAP